MPVPDRGSGSPVDSARLTSAALGVWLFISAFAWHHTMAQRTNTWISGVLAFVFALGAVNVPRLRFLNTILSVWLFISAFALPRISSATLWNNALVAIALFVTSLTTSARATPPSAIGPRAASPGA